MSYRSYSLGWKTSPENLITNSSMEHLRKRFPNIDSAGDIQRLLLDISQLGAYDQVEAIKSEDFIIIRGNKASQISNISVDSTSYSIEQELNNQLSRYNGLTNSKEIRANLIRFTLKHLQTRGYYNATIKIKQDKKGLWTQLFVYIEEDFPCRLRQVTLGFKLPEEISFQTKVGDVCNKKVINKQIEDLEEELSEMGFNQKRILKPELYYETKTNSALLVIPGSLGRKITYNIESPIKFNADLSRVDPLLDDPSTMKAEISRAYKKEGYDDVKVSEPKKQVIGRGQINYTFKVTPGPLYGITNVEFQGSRKFSKETMLEFLGLDQGFGTTPLDSNGIRTRIDRLKEKYQEEGYWDIEIRYPRITKDKETGNASLVFIIEEGKQRTFKDMIVQGNKFYSSADIEQLLLVKRDDPLSWSQLADLEKSLKKTYYSSGFLYMRTKIELVQDRTFRKIQIQVLVNIEENKRVRFGKTTISGLINTHKKVVTREIQIQEGDWYDPEKIETTRKSLSKLGIFSSIEIIQTNPNAITENAPFIRHTIKLREAKPGSISFGPGWSLLDGARYVIESSYSNIGGWGRKVFGKAQISEEQAQKKIANKTLLGNKVGLGFMEPYVFDIPINGIISLNHKAEAYSDIWEISKSGELTLYHKVRNWIDNSKLGIFYGQELTRLERKEIEKKPLIETGRVRTGRIGFRAETDQTNNISWPTAGFRSKAEVSWARFNLGGNLRYFKWDFKHSQFFGFFEDWVLAISSRFTAISDIDLKDNSPSILPTSERLYAGGAETNRGFQIRSLGPYFNQWVELEDGSYEEKNFYISGGSNRNIFKFELRHQILRETFAISFFLDCSNVFFSKKQINTFNKAFANEYDQKSEPKPEYPDSINENYYYSFNALFMDPSLIMKKNYLSYGLAANLLTALGSVDLSYGIPARRCLTDQSTCKFERGLRGNSRLESGVAHISIGASF